MAARDPYRAPQGQRTIGIIIGPGCGDNCTAEDGHDALTHERYGRYVALRERSRSGVVVAGRWRIDLGAELVMRDEEIVHLSPLELRLLLFLAGSVNRPRSYDDIAAHVWGKWGYTLDDVGIHAVRQNLQRLRWRMGEDGAMIVTVMKTGLMLRPKGGRTR